MFSLCYLFMRDVSLRYETCVLCFIMKDYFIVYHYVMSFYSMLCHVMLRVVMYCYVVLHEGILRNDMYHKILHYNLSKEKH